MPRVASEPAARSLLLSGPQGDELDLLATELDLELIAGVEVLDLNQLPEAGADATEALCATKVALGINRRADHPCRRQQPPPLVQPRRPWWRRWD
jgi:hypothetical protein